MKIYDPERKCEKCGFDRTEDEHCHEIIHAFFGKTQTVAEHISRKCLRCKFIWRESPLNTEPK